MRPGAKPVVHARAEPGSEDYIPQAIEFALNGFARGRRGGFIELDSRKIEWNLNGRALGVRVGGARKGNLYRRTGAAHPEGRYRANVVVTDGASSGSERSRVTPVGLELAGSEFVTPVMTGERLAYAQTYKWNTVVFGGETTARAMIRAPAAGRAFYTDAVSSVLLGFESTQIWLRPALPAGASIGPGAVTGDYQTGLFPGPLGFVFAQGFARYYDVSGDLWGATWARVDTGAREPYTYTTGGGSSGAERVLYSYAVVRANISKRSAIKVAALADGAFRVETAGLEFPIPVSVSAGGVLSFSGQVLSSLASGTPGVYAFSPGVPVPYPTGSPPPVQVDTTATVQFPDSWREYLWVIAPGGAVGLNSEVADAELGEIVDRDPPGGDVVAGVADEFGAFEYSGPTTSGSGLTPVGVLRLFNGADLVRTIPATAGAGAIARSVAPRVWALDEAGEPVRVEPPTAFARDILTTTNSTARLQVDGLEYVQDEADVAAEFEPTGVVSSFLGGSILSGSPPATPPADLPFTVDPPRLQAFPSLGVEVSGALSGQNIELIIAVDGADVYKTAPTAVRAGSKGVRTAAPVFADLDIVIPSGTGTQSIDATVMLPAAAEFPSGISGVAAATYDAGTATYATRLALGSIVWYPPDGAETRVCVFVTKPGYDLFRDMIDEIAEGNLTSLLDAAVAAHGARFDADQNAAVATARGLLSAPRTPEDRATAVYALVDASRTVALNNFASPALLDLCYGGEFYAIFS